MQGHNAGMSSLGYANAKGRGGKIAIASAVLQLLSENCHALYSAKNLFLTVMSDKDSVLEESDVDELSTLITKFTQESADIFISVSDAAEIDNDVIHISILCIAKHQ